MKAVVTGGAGFIGSHIVDLLILKGFEVVVLDNFSTGRPDNLKHHQGNEKLSLVQCDISDYDFDMTDLFAGAAYVFHMAALADIVPSINNPMGYHKSNVDGTINVLQAAKKAEVKKLVYAASSSCYGIPDVYPTPESAPARPQYPYALTKYVGEQYVMHWGQIYDLPVVSTRFFNVYGPRARTSGTYGAVFGVFLAQKLAGKPYTIVGDGEQTRDFTFVTDIAAACFAAAESDVKNEIVNVGSGNTYSINLLVDLLGGEKTYVPKRPGEPDCTFADTAKIRKLLNWKPKVSFEEGVKIMLENIESWRNAPVWDPESINEATKDWFKYLGKN